MTAAAETSWSVNDDTVSADDDTQVLFNLSDLQREDIPADTFDFFDKPDIVDGVIVDEPGSSKLKSDRPAPVDREASSGIPKIDDWMHFFSRVVLRLATDFYIDLAFRDIDEEVLTDREIQRIKLTDVERDRMARPFAEYSNKSKFMRKHGRMIIASADSIDAVLQIGMWVSRVNRIRAKYQGTRRVRAQHQHVRAAPIFRPTPKVVQPEFEDRSDENVGTGQSAPQPRPDHWRPDIKGNVFNPTGGG
jgi:hypothetical protein